MIAVVPVALGAFGHKSHVQGNRHDQGLVPVAIPMQPQQPAEPALPPVHDVARFATIDWGTVNVIVAGGPAGTVNVELGGE